MACQVSLGEILFLIFALVFVLGLGGLPHGREEEKEEGCEEDCWA